MITGELLPYSLRVEKDDARVCNVRGLSCMPVLIMLRACYESRLAKCFKLKSGQK